MKTPAPMTDLRHVDTGLSATEKAEARRAGLAQKAIAALGARWTCAPEHAPRRGMFNPLTGARLS
ncbi:hypothetical protein HTY52_28950 [Cupriavidus taiwanensis]|uniref:hypothetical protein n=1 Tax=Cupriavidus taiwanensis TaxID=164546 RepID=UPI0015727C6B|nr:hypothetical protein [Cupriavidus taiwanensis]NSX18136.1 hypothetical protein [Cupriavidus taiwanensis]